MKSSFGKYCGRFVATVSLATALAVAAPVLDEGVTLSAQTKTTAHNKKKGTSSSASRKKASTDQKRTSSNQKTTGSQKKGTQTQKKSNTTQKKSTEKKTTANQKKTVDQKNSRNKATNQKKGTQNQKKSQATNTPKSSAEAKRLQEATQREIQQTKEKLRLNEEQIKTGLSDLNRLSGEIATGRTQVEALQKKVSGLTAEIAKLGTEITKNEEELKLMREEYLKAVKKMRLTKKNQSTLAFIFASENFNQAMRRIRYMRQFSAWKERKSADIDGKIELLGKERERLSRAQEAQTVALGLLTESQNRLEENHRKQSQLVASLRQNGDALQAHLTAKQKEANRLKETISSLIAQELAKAEAERKAKAEAERIAKEKAEAEKRAATERAAAEKAAAEKAAAEKAAAKALAEKEAAEKALAAKSASEKAAAEKEAKEKAEAYKKAQEEKEKADRKFAEAKAKAEEKLRQEQEKEKKNNERTARRKSDRRDKKTDGGKEAVKSNEPLPDIAPKTAEKGANVNFASLRGSLPRPVDGTWRITNPFGRHAMPEMPEIEYDNPGIDAEVASGATVKSVCGGKVSGVYKVAGYGTVVIVNHGDYYTVYGNLASTNVAVGTQVGGGHALGTAGKDPDDSRRSSVHFEVWKGREKQNPSSWLR
ncbi:MAG: peptidoglycan DD-metalloendopeptidase family protein [Muribaculaceae bacterium]|nr:peptidoglycan DD-metalloendopeptidase family protein [Muribaculaceae bacterium]